MNKQKILQEGKNLVTKLSASAMSWGWQSDQGYELDEIKASEERFEADVEKLTAFIKDLVNLID